MNKKTPPASSSHGTQPQDSKPTEQERQGQYGPSDHLPKRLQRSRKLNKPYSKRKTPSHVDNVPNWRFPATAGPAYSKQQKHSNTGQIKGAAEVHRRQSNNPRNLDKHSLVNNETESQSTIPEAVTQTNMASMIAFKPTIMMLPPRGFEAKAPANEDDEDDLDTALAYFDRLSTKLEEQTDLIHISISASKDQFEDRFGHFLMQSPKAVIIMNSDFYDLDYTTSHDCLRRYLEDGGIVAIICECNNIVDIANCTKFMHHMGMNWNVRDFTHDKVWVNVKAVGGLYQTLPPALVCESFYLRYVGKEAAWYHRQVKQNKRMEIWRVGIDVHPLTPVAYTPRGKGKFGFVGGFRQKRLSDCVKADTIDDIIHTMCGLRVEPWETAVVPDCPYLIKRAGSARMGDIESSPWRGV